MATMLSFARSCTAILSKAGFSDEAANTVTVACGTPPLPLQAAMRAMAKRARTRLATRQLHADVGRLDDGDRRNSRFEAELVNSLAGQKRNETVGPGLDLDLRRNSVLDHAGDDAGEAVSRRLRDHDLGRLRPARFGKPGERCAVDHALAA